MRTHLFRPISIEQAASVARRFPFAMAVAVLGTILGIAMIHSDNPESYTRILLVLALGFPLFVAVRLWSERLVLTRATEMTAYVIGAAFLCLYYFWLPADIERAREMFFIRYALWAIGFVLLVTFVPFVQRGGKGGRDAFWTYNKTLVYSLILTGIWAAVIQAGISIALAAISFLFELDIDGRRYAELAMIVFGIFSTLFFLSRVPRGFDNIETAGEYPAELRLLAQYALTPLVALYFLILYAYVVRILILWKWPEGVLAYMILGFSLLGIAVYLILYPLRENTQWVRRMGTIFYIALIPQVAMLFAALWFRINQYGFTENRYFVFLFGWWLLAMAIYFLWSKTKDIRVIPISIFLIALLSSFGPWSAFAVSERSQINRLEELLIKNDLLVNTSVQKTRDREISLEDRREISAIMQYLYRVHGYEGVEEWFGDDFAEKNLAPAAALKDYLGIEYISEYDVVNRDRGYFSLTVAQDPNNRPAVGVPPADFYLPFEGPGLNRSVLESAIAGMPSATYEYGIGEGTSLFVIRKDNKEIWRTDLKEFLDKRLGVNFELGKQTQVEQGNMTISFQNDEVYAFIVFESISGQKREDGSYVIDFASGRVFLDVQ